MSFPKSLYVGVIATLLIGFGGSSSASDEPSEPVRDLDTAPVPVVGGTAVPDGRWPDAAGVYFGNSIGCTGVLVAPTVVLTAGHCIDNSIGQVMVGANNVNDVNGPGEVVSVARRVTYPSWWNTYDIGLLVLATPATTEPRLIVSDCVKDGYVTNGAPVTIVGYGAIDNNAQVYVADLMEATTTITDFDCSASGKGCMVNARPAGELGAGGNGVDSCNGDSGGPLYLNTPIGDFLIGLTSRGYDDNTMACSQGGIYVRPDKIIDWIEQQAGVTLMRPTCNLPPEPTAEPIDVDPGDTASTAIAPNDPDSSDTHVYVLTTPPQYGTAAVQTDGRVEYTADADYEGADTLVVTVSDNGVPNLSADAQIEIIVESGGGCACNSSGSPAGTGALVMLVAFGLIRPRRRA